MSDYLPQLPPLFIDFTSGVVEHRRRFGGGRGQALARAVGMKPGVTPAIVDATAGLGRDSFLLASLGAEVTMIERDDAIYALLADALPAPMMRAASTAISCGGCACFTVTRSA